MGEPALSPAEGEALVCWRLLVAARVRSYLLWQCYCITSDGVTYLRAVVIMAEVLFLLNSNKIVSIKRY